MLQIQLSVEYKIHGKPIYHQKCLECKGKTIINPHTYIYVHICTRVYITGCWFKEQVREIGYWIALISRNYVFPWFDTSFSLVSFHKTILPDRPTYLLIYAELTCVDLSLEVGVPGILGTVPKDWILCITIYGHTYMLQSYSGWNTLNMARAHCGVCV